MDTKDLKGLMEAYSEVYAPEQLDELSVNKMLAYGKAAQKDRDVLNKKWDEKKASQKEKMRVLGHEEGEDRAAEKIKKKTGKYPHQMNALDKARYAVTKEELDIFDVVLEFLQAEGYAETLEEAEWMMANMIDEEAIDIILGESALGTMAVLGGMAAGRAIHGKLQDRKAKKELEGKRRTSDYLTMKSRTKNAVFRDRRDSGDTRNEEYVDEAQHARENPEKYEREQSKKSAPVRGERTPMPPRGDKRREDFEKWYAKQMGR